MKLQEFIDEVKRELPASSSTDTFSNIYEFENVYSVNQLHRLLDDAKTTTRSERPVNLNSKTAEPFINFLKERWERVQGTDALEQSMPEGEANLACRELAKLLANNLNATIAAKLLFPTIDKHTFKLSSKKSIDLLTSKPMHYVWRDGSRDVVNVFTCLSSINQNVRDEKGNLQLFTTNQPLSKAGSPLSKSEKDRVVNHCEATKYFYENCNKAAANNKLSADFLGDQISIMQAGIKEHNLIRLYSYGEAGENHLARQLYQSINTLPELIEQLSLLPKHLWQGFVQFMPQEQADKIQADISRESVNQLLDANPARQSHILFGMFSLYGKERSAKPNLQPDYPVVRNVARLFQFAGNTKVSSANAVASLLTKGWQSDDVASLLSGNLNNDQAELYKQRNPALVNVILKNKDALQNKRLGQIVSIIVDRYAPEGADDKGDLVKEKKLGS